MRSQTLFFETIFNKINFQNKLVVVLGGRKNWVERFVPDSISSLNIYGNSFALKIKFKNALIEIKIKKNFSIVKYEIVFLDLDLQCEKIQCIKSNQDRFKLFEKIENKLYEIKTTKLCQHKLNKLEEIFDTLFEQTENEKIRNYLMAEIISSLKNKQILYNSGLDKKFFIAEMMQPGFKISTLPKFIEFLYFNRPDLMRIFYFQDINFHKNLINWFINYGIIEMKFNLFFKNKEIISKIVDDSKIYFDCIALIGYSNRTSGLSQNMKCFEKAFLKLGQKIQIFDVPNLQLSYENKIRIKNQNSKFENLNNYSRKLFFLNSLEYDTFLKNTNLLIQQNFVYWAWELEEFPPFLAIDTRHISGVWSISNFAANSLSKGLEREVYTLHIPISKPKLVKFTGKKYFLNIFDYLSDFQRKNPLALIDSYIKAFPKESSKISLVIKTSNHKLRAKQHDTLLKATSGRRDIKVITSVMSNLELDKLIGGCYAYVSLHRSEGFGIPLAKAMVMGKPVIATGYSGNLDFMDEKNSILLDYSMVSTDNAIEEIYSRCNSKWAEPSSEQASESILKLVENENFALELGSRGQRNVKDILSQERFEKKIKKIIRLNAQ